MDDIQLIIYLVFLGLYFLTRALSKKKKGRPRPGRQQPVTPTETTSEKPTPAPVTFEDMLRDFMGEKEKEPTPIEVLEPEPVHEEFETDYPSDDEIDEVYKKSVKDATEFKPSEDTIEIAPDSNRFKEYQSTDEENPLTSEIRDMLNDPYDAKKAIVLKEILDRPYK